MSSAGGSDPDEFLDAQGTSTAKQAGKGAISDTSGGAGGEIPFSDEQIWTRSDTMPQPATISGSTTASIPQRVKHLEKEVGRLQQTNHQLYSAGENLGVENPYDLLMEIGQISEDVGRLEEHLAEISQKTSTDENVDDTPSKSEEEIDWDNIEMQNTYTAVSQAVFVLLGLASIGVSILAQNTFMSMAATILVPILFILAFAGIVVERMTIREAI